MKQLTYQPIQPIQPIANQNEPGYPSSVTGKKLTTYDRLVIYTKLHPGLASYLLYELGVKKNDIAECHYKRQILTNLRFEL